MKDRVTVSLHEALGYLTNFCAKTPPRWSSPHSKVQWNSRYPRCSAFGKDLAELKNPVIFLKY